VSISQTIDFVHAGELLAQALHARDLTEAEKVAYSAPFPETIFTAGALEFPCLVPITPEHGGVHENLAAWKVLVSNAAISLRRTTFHRTVGQPASTTV
jgi:haloalkane dehalogenase